MGSIINAVAELDIHMDKNPVASIKPKTIRLKSVPNKFIMLSAIRLCRFHFSIDVANKNPPMYNSTVGSM